MKLAKTLNSLLWLLNILLGAGIVVFAFQFLLPTTEDPFEEGPRKVNVSQIIGAGKPIKGGPGLEAAKTLKNPMVQRIRGVEGTPSPNVPTGIELKGTMPMSDYRQGLAILQITSRNLQVVAAYGAPVKDDKDEILPEMRGWLLAEVYRDRAVFHGGSGPWELRKEAPPLNLNDMRSATRGRKKSSGPYNPKNYPKSRLIRQTPNQQTWLIDPGEADYIMENQQSILSRDLTLSAYSEGGVKIERLRAGSVGFTRGLKSGDVIKSVNNRAVNNLSDVKSLTSGAGVRRSRNLRLTIQRAGRTFTMEYRLGRR